MSLTMARLIALRLLFLLSLGCVLAPFAQAGMVITVTTDLTLERIERSLPPTGGAVRVFVEFGPLSLEPHERYYIVYDPEGNVYDAKEVPFSYISPNGGGWSYYYDKIITLPANYTPEPQRYNVYVLARDGNNVLIANNHEIIVRNDPTPPLLSNIQVSATQIGYYGGWARLEADITDEGADQFGVQRVHWELPLPPGTLLRDQMQDNGRFSARIFLPYNLSQNGRELRLRIVATDGVHESIGYAPVIAQDAAPSAPARLYRVDDLGQGYAIALNNQGRALLRKNGEEYYLWNGDALAHLPLANYVDFYEMNDQDQIIGSEGDNAVLWINGTLQTLDAGGYSSSRAYDINNQGKIVGRVGQYSCVWENGVLNLLLPTEESAAISVNAQGRILGYLGESGHETARFLWENGQVQVIQAPEGKRFTEDREILSDTGAIAGNLRDAETQLNLGFIWRNGVFQELSSLLRGGSVEDINAQNQAVGASWGGEEIAVLWQDNIMLNLNRHVTPVPGRRLSFARKINDQGQILCEGYVEGEDFSEHVFLLTPIEPRAVSTRIFLEGMEDNAQSASIHFTFRPHNGDPTFTYTVSIVSGIAQDSPPIPSGVYTLHIKGARWLARNVEADVRNGNLDLGSLSLKAGDISEDNLVDLFDLVKLFDSYGASEGDPEWLEGVADLKADGVVDLFDLVILFNNYGEEGDP